jgi:NAD(P)-dependent dehydrogenase (short-subunit alcohol dehydrogenase family)
MRLAPSATVASRKNRSPSRRRRRPRWAASMCSCSAGVAGLNAMTVDYPLEERKKVFGVNVVARSMKARGHGRIVNIASIAPAKEGNPTASAYSASKAAVIGLTKSLGKELAKSGVCLNAITPATIETSMLAQVSQAHIDCMRSKIPMERFGDVGEVAALVRWRAAASARSARARYSTFPAGERRIDLLGASPPVSRKEGSKEVSGRRKEALNSLRKMAGEQCCMDATM